MLVKPSRWIIVGLLLCTATASQAQAPTTVGGVDMAQPAPLQLERTFAEGITSVAVDGSGQVMATAARDGIIRVYLVNRGSGPAWHSHSEAPLIALSPDGRLLATTGADDATPEQKEHFQATVETVKLWDTLTGALEWQVELDRNRAGERKAITFSPDSKRIATSGGMFGSGELQVLDVATGKITQTLNKQTGPVDTAAFAPDSRTVVSSGIIKGSNFPWGVRVWDADSGQLQQEWKVENGLQALALAPDSKIVAVPTTTFVHVKTDFVETNVSRTKILLRDIVSGETKQMLTLANRPDEGPATSENVRQIAYSADGNLVAALIQATEMKKQGDVVAYMKPRFFLNVWDVKTGTIKATLTGSDRQLTAFAFFPDNRLAVSDSLGTVQIWKLP